MSTPPISNSTSVNQVANTGASSSATASSSTATSIATSGLADESTFLKLLVAQLKNQDPQNPADGAQFVAQLAQFSALEQQLGMKSDLDQILGILKNPSVQTASAPARTATT